MYMLRCGLISIFLVLILIFSNTVFASNDEPNGKSQGGLLVGFGVVDITPPLGVPLGPVTAGVDESKSMIADGLLDPLYAKAIVLDDGNTRIAIVALDLVSARRYLLDPARQRVAELTGISEELVMIHSTHAHTARTGGEGTLTSTGKISISPYADQDFLNILSKKIGDSVAIAADSMREVTMSIGYGEVKGIAFNRRYLMANGVVQISPVYTSTDGRPTRHPSVVKRIGPQDETLRVVVFRDKQDEPIGVIVNFGMHADIVKGTKFSADFPYFITKTIQSKYPNCNVIFLNGPCGNINHRDSLNPTKTGEGYEYAREVGIRIGTEALNIMEKAVQVKANPIDGRLLELSIERAAGLFVESYISALRIGDLALVGLPGEIFVETGFDIRDGSPSKHLIITGITNDSLGYIPTLQAFEEGGYEVRGLPGTAEMLRDQSLSLLAELYP